MNLMAVYFERGYKLHEKHALGSVCSVPGKARLVEAVGPSLNPLPETRGLERKRRSQESGSGTEMAMGTQEGVGFLRPDIEPCWESQLHLSSLEDGKLPCIVRPLAPRNAGNSQVSATASSGWRR